MRVRRGSLPVEPAHLTQGGPQAFLRKRGMADETIVLVANLVAASENDGHLRGLDPGVGGVVGRGRQVPLPVREETVAARVVGGGVRVANQRWGRSRRHAEVGGALCGRTGGRSPA